MFSLFPAHCPQRNAHSHTREEQWLCSVAVWCGVLQFVAVRCSALPRHMREVHWRSIVAVCCCVLRCVAVCCGSLQCVLVCFSVLQCVAVRCNWSMLCCSLLQCVNVRAAFQSYMSLALFVLFFLPLHLSITENFHFIDVFKKTLSLYFFLSASRALGRDPTDLCR